MFRPLLFIGRLIQVIATLIPILVIAIASAITFAYPTPTNQTWALWVSISGIFSALILYAFGGLICVNVMAFRNSQRIAGALNRMARAQTGIAEFIPPMPQPTEYTRPATEPKRPVR